MALSKKPYKGTRDFLPPDKRAQDYLFEKMHQSAQLFGFEHYDGPLLEEVELYKAKSGEELINDQIYSFVDRGKRFVAIRPEMTPTLARMVSRVHREIPKPIRWYSIPNLFRYEKPQRGRLREHWQFNCDIFGAPGRTGEVEIIQLLVTFLESFGANDKHFEVLINDRTIVDGIFNTLTSNQDTVYRLYKLVDKSRKIPEDALLKELSELDLEKNSQKHFLKYLSLKSFEQLFSFLSELGLNEAAKDFREFYAEVEGQLVAKYLNYDPTIVRGLDYYTGIVFEVFDKHPDNRRAISGGGAYANLLQIFNEPALAGVGFGLGDVTLQDFLESHNLMPDCSKANVDLVISYQIAEGYRDLGELATLSRQAGFKTVFSLESVKFKKVFSQAEKLGAKFVTLYGDQEKADGNIVIKNLDSKEQQAFPINDIEQIIKFIFK
jgi:histidyl-tRNA synthetase